MKDSYADGTSQVGQGLNAVTLQNAVLCAECDVVSDSPKIGNWPDQPHIEGSEHRPVAASDGA